MHQQIALFILISPYLALFLLLVSFLIKEEEFKYKILGFISIILGLVYFIPILFALGILIFTLIKLTIEIINNPQESFFLISLLLVFLLNFLALYKKSSKLITILYTSLAIILWTTASKLLKFIGISIDFTEFTQALPIYLLSSVPSQISLLDFLLNLFITIVTIFTFFFATQKYIIFFVSLLTGVYYYIILWIFTINFISITYSTQLIYFPLLKYLFTFTNFYISSNLPAKFPIYKTDKGPIIIIGKKIYLLNCVQKVLIQKKFKEILCKSINQIEKRNQLTLSSFYIALTNLSLSSNYLSTIEKDIEKDFISIKIVNLSSIPIFSIAINCSYPRDYLNYWNPKPLSYKEEIKFLNNLKRYCTKN